MILFVTAELLVAKNKIIDCHFTSASSALNFCMKIVNDILVRCYYWLVDIIYKSDTTLLETEFNALTTLLVK